MKLRKFYGRKIYGYLDFDIEFHDDLSILIGVNGSGKTTLLLLVQALLSPSLKDLTLIPFSYAHIAYEDKGIEYFIWAEKEKACTAIRVSSLKEQVLTLPKIGKDELAFLLHDGDRSEKYFAELQIKYSNHPVFNFILKINAPVFLGLDRTHRNESDSSDRYYSDRESIRKTYYDEINVRLIKGSLTAGLTESQNLIQKRFQRLREIENSRSKRLRESILLSTIRYHDFSSIEQNLKHYHPSASNYSQIMQRKDEIYLALSNAGLSGKKIGSELDNYFEKLEILYLSMLNKPTEGFSFEWLMNIVHIEKFANLITIIDENKSELKKLFAPIDKFIESVNYFFADSRKSITINTVGHLSVMQPNKEGVPIDALSSGERQIIIIYAHLLFNESGKSNVFIIDEPELSLHLRWQENFVEKALEANSNTQLILATHSPEIIGGYENKNISI